MYEAFVISSPRRPGKRHPNNPLSRRYPDYPVLWYESLAKHPELHCYIFTPPTLSGSPRPLRFSFHTDVKSGFLCRFDDNYSHPTCLHKKMTTACLLTAKDAVRRRGSFPLIHHGLYGFLKGLNQKSSHSLRKSALSAGYPHSNTVSRRCRGFVQIY